MTPAKLKNLKPLDIFVYPESMDAAYFIFLCHKFKMHDDRTILDIYYKELDQDVYIVGRMVPEWNW